MNLQEMLKELESFINTRPELLWPSIMEKMFRGKIIHQSWLRVVYYDFEVHTFVSQFHNNEIAISARNYLNIYNTLVIENQKLLLKTHSKNRVIDILDSHQECLMAEWNLNLRFRKNLDATEKFKGNSLPKIGTTVKRYIITQLDKNDEGLSPGKISVFIGQHTWLFDCNLGEEARYKVTTVQDTYYSSFRRTPGCHTIVGRSYDEVFDILELVMKDRYKKGLSELLIFEDDITVTNNNCYIYTFDRDFEYEKNLRNIFSSFLQDIDTILVNGKIPQRNKDILVSLCVNNLIMDRELALSHKEFKINEVYLGAFYYLLDPTNAAYLFYCSSPESFANNFIQLVLDLNNSNHGFVVKGYEARSYFTQLPYDELQKPHDKKQVLRKPNLPKQPLPNNAPFRYMDLVAFIFFSIFGAYFLLYSGADYNQVL